MKGDEEEKNEAQGLREGAKETHRGGGGEEGDEEEEEEELQGGAGGEKTPAGEETAVSSSLSLTACKHTSRPNLTLNIDS